MSENKKSVGRPRVRPSEAELAAMYANHPASYIAKQFNVSLWTARNWIEYYKRNPETGEMKTTTLSKSGRLSKMPPEAELAALYSKYPASYIADKYDVSVFTVRTWIQHYRHCPTNADGINVMPDKERPRIDKTNSED